MPHQKSHKILAALAIAGVGGALTACHSSHEETPTDLAEFHQLRATLNAAAQTVQWPDGYCASTYGSIQQQAGLLRQAALVTQQQELADNAEQLALQAAAMQESPCELAESGALTDGQLQTRYLRADMTAWLWKLQLLAEGGSQVLPPITAVVNPVDARNFRPLTHFQDAPELLSSQLVVLPAGQFWIGGTEQEHAALNVDAYRAAWEIPRRPVMIEQAFAMASTEVTVADFETFLNDSGYQVSRGCLGFPGFPAMDDPNYTMDVPTWSWRYPGFAQDKNEPVLCVTRGDAMAYAQWLSAKTGATYRLPSEAEWEYAARAGTETAYFWGDSIEQGCRYAAIYDLSTDAATGFGFVTAQCNDGTPYTASVGSFLPNPWGLYDMTGNAREWVSDAWEDSYATGPVNQNPRTAGVAQFPVLRGGGWNYMPQNERIAYRSAYYSLELKSNMWGFRLVREL
ncbi:formylglycine-generating enzyme family protein [Lampropedia aestuarii]|uniref:formylglycine-generating enzyme family protein n=1 Tax=Lampropedia aestuarii TaxID=2562762 RepID=UPI002468DA41|nr:SUMF1/EgtB/PvdO family nonheme iron enzyme [Lampropedia aestuarii]MDH5857493.1 SUMF1/EgtB/PvdO family nonheme iron enzyme [Lampropedia aestuarii]